jgi:hypothetical protein
VNDTDLQRLRRRVYISLPFAIGVLRFIALSSVNANNVNNVWVICVNLHAEATTRRER